MNAEPFNSHELKSFQDRVCGVAVNGMVLVNRYDLERCLATIAAGPISELSRQQVFTEALQLSSAFMESAAQKQEEIDALKRASRGRHTGL